MQQDVRIRRACSSHRPSRGGRVATDREFVCRQLFHTAAVHHQHNYISGFAADLGAKASASELDCRGTSPLPVAAAEREPATILPTNYEGSFLQPGDDHDTLGFCQKILRYALIRRRQDLIKDRGSGPQPVVWRLLLGMERTKRQTDHQKHSRHIFESLFEIADLTKADCSYRPSFAESECFSAAVALAALRSAFDDRICIELWPSTEMRLKNSALAYLLKVISVLDGGVSDPSATYSTKTECDLSALSI